MTPGFEFLDWCVVALYFAVMVAAGIYFMPRDTEDAKDYFLAGGELPPWLAAVSVISATMSAATFLGGPDYTYRGDFTYLSSNIGAVLSAIFAARVLIPRYYAMGVTTVYELLDRRFGPLAMRAAGGMFLVGRVLAGGTRIYLGAIAVSMIMFGSIGAGEIFIASLALVVISFVFTFVGGLKAVVWNDLVQTAIYVGSAVAILVFLWLLIPESATAIIAKLETPAGGGPSKLELFDFSLDLSRPFTMPAIFTGVFLLCVGNNGLDQDTTQRLLACKDANAGAKSLIMSQLMVIPIVAIFMAIGSLLYVFYDGQAPETYQGRQISVFMHFILTRIPPGLRGLATTGVIAAAVATTNSAMNAMSSVLIEDFYRPWSVRHGKQQPERHFVRAGRVGMALMGLAMFVIAVASYYWQQYANVPLLELVLGVMAFAYAGLLGVYFCAIFTKRGSSLTVVLALAAGFVSILVLQKYVATLLGLPPLLTRLAFPWQLCIGTLAAFLVCVVGSPPPATAAGEPHVQH